MEKKGYGDIRWTVKTTYDLDSTRIPMRSRLQFPPSQQTLSSPAQVMYIRGLIPMIRVRFKSSRHTMLRLVGWFERNFSYENALHCELDFVKECSGPFKQSHCTCSTRGTLRAIHDRFVLGNLAEKVQATPASKRSFSRRLLKPTKLQR